MSIKPFKCFLHFSFFFFFFFFYWQRNVRLYMSYCCSDPYENSDRTHRVHVVRIRSGLTLMVWLILHSEPTLNPHPIWTSPHTYSAHKWAAAWQNQQTNLCAQRRLRSAWARVLHADSEGSDHTVWLPSLIRVFAGHTGHFVGFVALRLKWQ